MIIDKDKERPVHTIRCDTVRSKADKMASLMNTFISP